MFFNSFDTDDEQCPCWEEGLLEDDKQDDATPIPLTCAKLSDIIRVWKVNF